MDLKIETLDPVEAPLSDQFWEGFIGGAGIVLGVAALVT